MRRCLSDDELGKIFYDGPFKLAEHSEDIAHQHIVHELCPLCIVKLINLIALHFYTQDGPKH